MTTYTVKIKTIDEMATDHRVTILNSKEAGHPGNMYFATHDDSQVVFYEDFNGMLPENRVVEIKEDGNLFICEIDCETFKIDDYMIDDNYNA